jgi:NADP-dependent 3-hydroxy acid dehydrogenase YdfG
VRDKVIIITGASAGIGAALAEQLGARGASLVLAGRRADALADVASRSGGHALAVVADVTSRDDVQRIVRSALDRFGHIDVLVNNAGQGITRQPSELTDEDVDLMMRVNVKSVLYGMQEVLPHFKKRGAGHVINISSELGRIPYAVHRSAYSAAKHFMNALTAMFRDEVQQTHPNIEFSIVSPGIVKTEFGVRAQHGGPDSRQFAQAQTAGEAAAVIADVIVSRRRDVYTRPDGHKRVVDYYAGLAT